MATPKTDNGVTHGDEPGKSVSTVFIRTLYDNNTESQMNMPGYVRETKSAGENAINSLPVPI